GAADRGLRIVASGELEGLPPDLGDRIAPSPPAESRAAALCRAKVVIGADAEIGSATFAAPVVFDAAAAGAAVITPHEFATIHDFGVGGMGPRTQNLIPIVKDGDGVRAEIDRLLADDLRHGEIVSHLQRIVAHNHTYRHRLATLASAVGYRLTPDALDPAPA
ncbi:MAG TPA: glycosyltransferase, partial [Solirubrobacterales bacterium]